MIRVVIVDDSLVIRNYLQFILSSDKEIEVVGTAANGKAGVELVKKCRPDVVTMDINMPEMDGFTATREIMGTNPTPIVICSGSYNKSEVGKAFKAIEAGAVSIIEKPRGITNPAHSVMAKALIDVVKQAAHAKVYRRQKTIQHIPLKVEKSPKKPILKQTIRHIAIGSSTGGPLVLQEILNALPANFSLPILIVQHIATGFTEGMVSWLASSAKIKVELAKNGEYPRAGVAYFAPDDMHLTLTRGGVIQLLHSPKEHSVRPSVSVMFRSFADHHAQSTLAILLTGMGKDGSTELKLLKDAGAVTIAQDKESSVVFGMPGEAVKLGGATHILNPKEIIAHINLLNN